MKSTEFCYWLQGWFELNDTIDHREGATKETLDVIRKHLDMVFYHEIDKNYPSEEQSNLNAIHQGIDLNPLSNVIGPVQGKDGELMRC